MDFKPLPFHSSVTEYEKQAVELFAAWQSGDAGAIEIVHQNHPRFLDERIPWLPKDLSESEIRGVPLELADAQLALARRYSFQNWERLREWVEAASQPDSPVAKFEAAVDAVITGDAATLDRLLREDPELVRRRSTRVTHHDPPVHAATLLHYIAANGVEDYNQRTPENAVEIAQLLLDRGADPDALAGMYGGQCAAMSMLVSSSHPAQAGVQVALVDILVDNGASVEARGVGPWVSPLQTALVFGYFGAAEALVRRGARIDTLAVAAGLGRLPEAHHLLAVATSEERHHALALAAQNGRVEIVRLLLDAGEDPDRYNPEGGHKHSTPLHQAACAGHDAVVRLLVERGARLDIKDTIYHGTPLGWAEHCGQPAIADYLRARMRKEEA
jgi:ankyrin repeat protein